MNLREFSDKWIVENVSDFYPEMSNSVREFVAMLIRQHHSGSSLFSFMRYITMLMEDYHNQEG